MHWKTIHIYRTENRVGNFEFVDQSIDKNVNGCGLKRWMDRFGWPAYGMPVCEEFSHVKSEQSIGISVLAPAEKKM